MEAKNKRLLQTIIVSFIVSALFGTSSFFIPFPLAAIPLGVAWTSAWIFAYCTVWLLRNWEVDGKL